MNKLQAMEVFVQVVDAGGFTRAAENMQLPKATVSTLIQSLEAALAVKLLHRTTRQVSVTADGAAYYERCLRILSDVREAEESLSRTRLSPSGRLRVDAPTSLASHVLVPALPDFFERYPDIALELGCSDRPVDLIEEGVDCAVRGGELGDSALIARRIAVINFVSVAAPSYLARYGTPLHPHDLAHHRCVNYFSSKTGKIFNWDFNRNGERIEVTLPGVIALNDSNAYVEAGLAGLGVLQMAHRTARQAGVEHRHDEDLAGQRRAAAVARHQRADGGQVGAGLDAGHQQALAAPAQLGLVFFRPQQHGVRVLDCGRERPLGGQRVIGRQDQLRRLAGRQVAQEFVGLVQVAVDKAAAVEEHDQRVAPGGGAVGRAARVDARRQRAGGAADLDLAYLQLLLRLRHFGSASAAAAVSAAAPTSSAQYRPLSPTWRASA